MVDAMAAANGGVQDLACPRAAGDRVEFSHRAVHTGEPVRSISVALRPVGIETVLRVPEILTAPFPEILAGPDRL